MKRIFIWMVVAVISFAGNAANMSVQTRIFDGNSQPPIVGGVIDNYAADEVLKKGIIVSANSNNVEYNESEYMYNPSYYCDDSKSVDPKYAPLGIKDYRILDCSTIGAEQFWCTLKLLKSDKDYYVRTFVVTKDGSTLLGNVEKVHTQSFSRYNGASDYANVWYAFSYTLFDLMTDEIIDPSNGFYYSTNENPTNVRFQKGTSYNTCYKYATEWNYKLWYYHNANHCNKSKIINLPIMTYSNGKLTIAKNVLDADKNITIYYSIDGNYYRPESFKDVYQQPISVSSPCTVYCYAISSDGYISYTNMYVVGDGNNDGNEGDNNNIDVFGKVADVVDLGLSVKWASWNLGASQIGDYGGLYGAGDPTGLKKSIDPKDYYFQNNSSICGTEYDLAYVKWGEPWRMPTWSELEELKTKCTWTDGEVNGIKGNWVKGPNGNSIFLPWAGLRHGEDYSEIGTIGHYYSGDMETTWQYTYCYKDFETSKGGVIQTDGSENYWGQSIRPVYVVPGNEGNGYDASNYKSLDDYISNSEVSLMSNSEQYSISPIIRNVKKIYIDLTKGTSNSAYCYLGIYNDADNSSIGFSSKHLQSTSTDNLVLDNKRYSIKNVADKNSFSWLYYNPDNPNEVVFDVVEYFGRAGFISKWQKNFGTSCIVNIVTGDSENHETPVNWNDGDSLIVKDVTTLSGKTVSVGIELENKTTDFTAYQFDLSLPDGFTLATDNDGKFQVTKTNRYEDDGQTLTISKMTGNTWRFVCFSLSNGTIEGTTGAILKAVLAVEDTVKTGSYEGIISNVVFTKVDGKQLKLNGAKFNIVVSNMLKGDTNGDGEINVADIVEIVNYILEKPSEIFVMEAADMNGDGEVNVTDVVMVVSIIMTDQSNAARSMGNMAEVLTDDDRLTLTEDSGRRLALCIENRDGYVASQFDVRVSEGQTIDNISLSGKRGNGHLLTYAKTADNTYKVVVYSLGNEVFAGNSGELINFEVTGNGIVSIENIVFVTTGHQEKRFPLLNSGTSTAIEVIDHSPLTIDRYYDLQGRRVTNGQWRKGVYIKNSKKNVVR